MAREGLKPPEFSTDVAIPYRITSKRFHSNLQRFLPIARLLT